MFRGIFIAVGAAAINEFSWIFYLFGAFLVYTAIHLARQGENDDEDFKENAVIRFAKKRLNATDEYNGVKLTVLKNGKRLVTPMAIVIIALGTTDLLFALDSIPAIYGLTQEPFLVFTANVFALMGLRQLYFLLGDLLKRLVYLSIGLSVVLAFIGVKLVLHAMHVNELPFINGGHHIEWAPEIPIWFSLGFIIITLGITTIASLRKSRTLDADPATDTDDTPEAPNGTPAASNGTTGASNGTPAASNGTGSSTYDGCRERYAGARARPEDQGRARRHPRARAARVRLQEALTDTLASPRTSGPGRRLWVEHSPSTSVVPATWCGRTDPGRGLPRTAGKGGDAADWRRDRDHASARTAQAHQATRTTTGDGIAAAGRRPGVAGSRRVWSPRWSPSQRW